MESKKFALVSDFDGTLTNKDFYQIIIDDYLGEEGDKLFNEWVEKKYNYKDFLDKLCNAINKNDSHVLEEVLRIEWDNTADKVIEKIQKAEGDFVILSHGTGYYIQKLLHEKGLFKVKLYSNEEYNEMKNFNGREKELSYSFCNGIDKVKIINYLKEKYPYIYYVGDSLSDIVPCKLADECFAKGALQHMLSDQKVDFIPINNFSDIEKYLIEKEVISGEDKF